MQRLEQAKTRLAASDCTCVICSETDMRVSTKRGVAPLLEWLDIGLSLQNYAAADKVVGDGAAHLYVLLRIQALHAEVLSRAALRTLEKHHIPVTYTTLTEAIQNREQTGPCPIEAAVAGITDPHEAYTAIRKRLAEINMKRGHHMEAITNLVTRRSIRKFKSDMVPKEIIEQIIEAGTYAATGRNFQSPIILAVTNKEMRDRLSKWNASIMGSEHDPFYNAPALLIVLADRSVPTYLYDGSLVMGSLMHAAHAHGIGSCWIHRAKEEFDSEEGRAILKELGIEGDYEGIGHCILGYADGEQPTAAPRKENYVYWME